MNSHSSPQGTMRSISPRNRTRRVVFAYLSNPSPSVNCLLIELLRFPLLGGSDR